MDLARREHSFYTHLYLSPSYKGALCLPRTWEGKQSSIDCASRFSVCFYANLLFFFSHRFSLRQVLVLLDRTFEYEIEGFSTL